MSRSQKRTRFINFSIEIETILQSEDIHFVIGFATSSITIFLDAVAKQSQISFSSVSLIAFPFTDSKVPEIAASLHGIAVYTGGTDTDTIRENIQGVHHNLLSREFVKCLIGQDEISDAIGLDLEIRI